jgi:hypothetical protein
MSLFDSARWRQQDLDLDGVDVQWALHPLNSSTSNANNNNNSLRGGWSGPRVSMLGNLHAAVGGAGGAGGAGGGVGGGGDSTMLSLVMRGSFFDTASSAAASVAATVGSSVPQLVSPLTSAHIGAMIHALHQPSVTLSAVVAHVNGVDVPTPNVWRGFDVVAVRHTRILKALELATSNTAQFGPLIGTLLELLPLACLTGQPIATVGVGLFLIGTAGSVSYNYDAQSLLVVGGQSFGMVLLSNAVVAHVAFIWQQRSGSYWERESNGINDADAIRSCLEAHRPELHESLVPYCRVVAFEAPPVNEIDANHTGSMLVTLSNGDQCSVTVEFWRGTTSQVAIKKSAVTPHF